MASKTGSLFLVVSSFFLSGCDDVTDVPNPPLSKGTVLDKQFIPAQRIKVQQVLHTSSRNYYAISSTTEIYLVVIGTTEKGKSGNKLYHRGFFSVTPALFGEIQSGQEIDLTSNPNARPVDLD